MCVLGAAAGSFRVIGKNSELVPSHNLINSKCTTKVGFLTEKGGIGSSNYHSAEFGLLGNLYYSEVN